MARIEPSRIVANSRSRFSVLACIKVMKAGGRDAMINVTFNACCVKQNKLANVKPTNPPSGILTAADTSISRISFFTGSLMNTPNAISIITMLINETMFVKTATNSGKSIFEMFATRPIAIERIYG